MKSGIKAEMITVITIMGLGVLAMSILNPILPLYLTSIGVSPEILGLMFSVGMVGMVIGESAWGWIADRLGLKLPLNIGTFVSALVVIFFTLTQHVLFIFAIFFFWGIVRSALFGPGRGYIGSTAPPLRKATFMAIIAAMLSASRSLGALPSGFIADNWGFQTVFFVSSGIALLAGLIVLITLRGVRLAKPAQANTEAPMSDQLLPLNQGISYRRFSVQCLVTSLHFLGLGVTIAFLPLLATQVIGVAATEVGILFTIRGLGAMVLGIPMGMLADRIGKRRFMILGLLVTAGAMTGTAYAPSYAWLIVFTIISSLGLTMFSPAALGLLSDSIPLNRQSTAMGIYGGVCENTGIIAGSAIGGFVWATLGPRPTFLMGAIAAGLGAVLCFSLIREKEVKAL
jgi:MFS family permease